MTVHSSQEVTQLLQAWCRSEQSASDKLMPLVYAELLKVSGGTVMREWDHAKLWLLKELRRR